MEEIFLINTVPKIQIQDVPLRVLGICGSPRAKSNSKILLDLALEGALETGNVEVETYLFNKKQIAACTACNAYCIKNKECVHKDGFAEFAEKWLRADAIIWSMPVYTMSGPALVRAAMDRLGEVFLGNRIEQLQAGGTLPHFMKACGAIAQGSSRFGNQEIVLEGMIDHFVLMDCIPVCADMPHSHTGVAGHIVDKTEPNDNEGLLTESRMLGRRVAEVGKLLKLGKLAIADSLSDDYFCAPDSFANTQRPEVD